MLHNSLQNCIRVIYNAIISFWIMNFSDSRVTSWVIHVVWYQWKHVSFYLSIFRYQYISVLQTFHRWLWSRSTILLCRHSIYLGACFSELISNDVRFPVNILTVVLIKLICLMSHPQITPRTAAARGLNVLETNSDGVVRRRSVSCRLQSVLSETL